VFDVNMMYNIALFVAHLASVASWQPAPKLWRGCASQRCARRGSGLHMNLLRDFTDTIKAGGSGGSTALTLDLERENEEVLQRYRTIVDLVNAREAEIEVLSDDALQARSRELRARVSALSRDQPEDDSIIVEGFALVREAAWRVLQLRPYDVQLFGGLALLDGRLAEMATGEGKTLAAVAPTYLAALRGHGAHVVTANDYLAQRDADCVGQVHRFLGLSVGLVQSSMGTGSEERKEAYLADIT
jgi:preprotein translocase subunit SecA